MSNLLITGGAGFIGANFVHYWLQHHPNDRIVVLDAITYAGNIKNLDSVQDNRNFRFIHGNILDLALLEKIFKNEQIDTVVHFAAESHVDRSIVDPDAFIQTNVVATHHLLRTARAAWMNNKNDSNIENKRFHHVSTDEVYGSLGPNDPAFSETTPYAPNSPYSASKASSDFLVRAYHHTYGLPVTISNCSNNYGPYHFPEKLIPLIIVNILEGKPLPIYGDGMNIRDWLYVKDHCRGIELILQKGRIGETYNIGGNNEKTNIEIVKLVCNLVDECFASDQTLAKLYTKAPPCCGKTCDSLITFVKDRPGHDRRYAIDATKARIELGYQPSVTFEQGIRLTIKWFLENESWWRAVMDGSYRQWIEQQYGK